MSVKSAVISKKRYLIKLLVQKINRSLPNIIKIYECFTFTIKDKFKFIRMAML